VQPIKWRFVFYQVLFASAIYLIASTVWLFLFMWGGESISGALARLAGLSAGSFVASAIYVLRFQR
jgi:hypothetical protein